MVRFIGVWACCIRHCTGDISASLSAILGDPGWFLAGLM